MFVALLNRCDFSGELGFLDLELIVSKLILWQLGLTRIAKDACNTTGCARGSGSKGLGRFFEATRNWIDFAILSKSNPATWLAQSLKRREKKTERQAETGGGNRMRSTCSASFGIETTTRSETKYRSDPTDRTQEKITGDSFRIASVTLSLVLANIGHLRFSGKRAWKRRKTMGTREFSSASSYAAQKAITLHNRARRCGKDGEEVNVSVGTQVEFPWGNRDLHSFLDPGVLRRSGTHRWSAPESHAPNCNLAASLDNDTRMRSLFGLFVLYALRISRSRSLLRNNTGATIPRTESQWEMHALDKTYRARCQEAYREQCTPESFLFGRLYLSYICKRLSRNKDLWSLANLHSWVVGAKFDFWKSLKIIIISFVDSYLFLFACIDLALGVNKISLISRIFGARFKLPIKLSFGYRESFSRKDIVTRSRNCRSAVVNVS